MKIISCALIAAGLLVSGPALARPASSGTSAKPAAPHQPYALSARDMDEVTAGLGANNVAIAPWSALLDVGFTLNHNENSEPGAAASDYLFGVAVPSAVPNSVCVRFCS